MDTAERTSVEPATFDGFISYSHAADDLLAPRLQAGLQRFAKPWWKRRAVRIFRDESSLAANPHLWSSITDALDDSSWFVLLLSQDAATSEWVGREIQHWIANKPSDRILPVVTDGTFGWENGDVTGSSVPPALHGVFTEEPRWVDLRFARGEEQLDLQNPDFSAAVADIAATIRGVPKDELASEEVKQHRRTVRTAWAAGITVTVLAIAAIVAGVFAIGQRNDARDAQDLAEQNATLAQQNADRAETEADRANQEADRANTNAEEATRNAQLAQARELAASSISMLDLDPELATLLAIAAIDASPEDAALPVQTENALWRAGSTNRLIDSFDFDHAGNISLSQDGARLAATTGPQELTVFNAASKERLFAYSEETVDFFTQPAWGPDGRLALAIIDSTSDVASGFVAEPDELPNRIAILEGESGDLIHTIMIPDCNGAELPAWSPNGTHLAISNGSEGCPRVVDGVSAANWIEVFDTDSWESVAWLPVDGEEQGPVPRFDGSGGLHALAPGRQAVAFEPDTYELRLRSEATGIGDVSSDGSRYFVSASATATGGTGFSAWVMDAATGETLDVIYTGVAHPSIPLGINVTPDDRFVVVGTGGAFTHVFDATSSYELFRLPTGDLFSSAFDPSGELLYTSGADGGIKVWDLRESAVGVQSTGDLGPYTWVNGTGFSIGGDIGGMETIDFGTFEWAVQFFELSTGELIGEPLPGTAGPAGLANGWFRVVEFESGLEFLFDPRTGERSDPGLCESEEFDEKGFFICTGPEDPESYVLLASVDGSELLASGAEAGAGGGFAFTGHFWRLDPDTGNVLESVKPGEPFDGVPSNITRVDVLTENWVYGEAEQEFGFYDRDTGNLILAEPFIPDGLEWSPSAELIWLRTGTRMVVFDTQIWEPVADVSFPTRVRGGSFNADGSRIAVGTIDALIVIDTATEAIVRQLRLPGVSDVYWMDDETLLVGTNRGLFGTVSLSTDSFLADVRSNLRRSFNDRECSTYRIDPCPSLEEIKAR